MSVVVITKLFLFKIELVIITSNYRPFYTIFLFISFEIKFFKVHMIKNAKTNPT